MNLIDNQLKRARYHIDSLCDNLLVIRRLYEEEKPKTKQTYIMVDYICGLVENLRKEGDVLEEFLNDS